MSGFIPTDPMELLQWVNNMNNGCGKIEDFPGGVPLKGKGLNTLGKQVNCAAQYELDMVSSQYGVTLTSPTSGCWTSLMVHHVTSAFDSVDLQLMTIGFSFRTVFGGLEFQLAPNVFPNSYAETASGRLVNWYDLGIAELDGQHIPRVGTIPEHLIVHELGHVLENRTASRFAGDIPTVGGVPSIIDVAREYRLPETRDQTIARGSYNLDSDKEKAADMFLFWVFDPTIFDSLGDTGKAHAYVDGGAFPLVVDASTTEYPYSPGIRGWVWAASHY